MIGFRRKKTNHDPFSIQEGVFRHGRIEGYSYRLNWTEEFYSNNDQGETIGRTFDFGKLKLIIFFLALLLTALVLRVAWLQVFKGDYYYSLAEGNRIRIQRIEAKRGIIYDRNHKPLVANVANFLLYFVPADLPRDEQEKSKIISRVKEILGAEVDIQGILQTVKSKSLESYQPLFIADNIDYDKAVLLSLESDAMPGVILSNKTRREYNLSASSLSHVLGYTGKINREELGKFGQEYLPIDYVGKMGVEYFWETEMRGQNGQKYIEVDALGKEKSIISQTKPIDGHNLVLSIDEESQKKLEEILNVYLEKMKLTKATGIIMDPNNGEIISLVSLPAYDNNKFARGISIDDYNILLNDKDRPLFNRVVSGEYPSGSTIKPVWAVSALQEGIINEHTSFLSTGGISVSVWFFPDWRSGGHGVTDVRKAISDSVNTFFYYIGGGYNDFQGLGIDRLVSYGKKFGLGAQTGIDLAGEASGFLPTKEWKNEVKKEAWYIGDTYHVAIGQGDLLATPLQVANYTTVFANGGTLYNPHLIKEILTGDDKSFKKIIASPIRSNFIDSKNIEIVREGMRQTVTQGSGRRLNSLPVTVAGKTGTAQWSTKADPHAWFTGFAPYEDPQIVITILVEEGKEGSEVAVSIVYDFLNWYYNR